MQTRVIDGFEVALFEDAPEPYIPDVELGKRLGFKRPWDVRRLIRRWYDSGHLVDTRCERRSQSDDVNSRRGGANAPHGVARRGRPANAEYFLGEADTLFIVTKSETDLATEITKQIIQVFMAWRRGHLAQLKTDPAMGQALAAIHDEIKTVRLLTTHIAKAVGIPLPGAIAREAKSRNRRHHSLEKAPGIQMHVEHLFELGRTYAEIVESVWKTFHLKISKSSLSRAYRHWTVRTGRTTWSPRLTLLS